MGMSDRSNNAASAAPGPTITAINNPGPPPSEPARTRYASDNPGRMAPRVSDIEPSHAIALFKL